MGWPLRAGDRASIGQARRLPKGALRTPAFGVALALSAGRLAALRPLNPSRTDRDVVRSYGGWPLLIYPALACAASQGQVPIAFTPTVTT